MNNPAAPIASIEAFEAAGRSTTIPVLPHPIDDLQAQPTRPRTTSSSEMVAVEITPNDVPRARKYIFDGEPLSPAARATTRGVLIVEGTRQGLPMGAFTAEPR